MKSYGEFCALARALDVVGDRWTMLVIRELLIAPSRYSDLQKSLPGIATNLLAQRLRTLEEAGVVTSAVKPAPVSARVYALTEWGRGLQSVLVGLARWGVPLLTPGAEGDHSRGRWLVFAIMALYPDRTEMADGAEFPTLTASIIADGDNLLLTADEHGVRTVLSGAPAPAEVTIEGTSEEVFRTLSGEQTGKPKAVVSGTADALRLLARLTSHAHTYGLDLAVLNR
ncbi:winged helix-turn-helix transcriptional regulator [Nocardia fluminea]|uniref:HxlR family transcriptional regulator n=1 Tax=Nocardia fluminea TaxID=134984 RepID=A0A2N3VJT9_9NOCA|nr:helix-turn-helix domain-containing protein [Nocardia fluminea]PKV81881.1 HxlR family transcriptional regulator [Nocardia fluminea]